MITTLSRQGGRRYPQMGNTGLAFVGWLLSGGLGAVVPVVSTHSPYYFEFSEYAEARHIDPMERIRARIAQDNEDIIFILMSIVDKL